MVEQPKEIERDHENLCLLNISKEMKNGTYMEKENITFNI